MFQLPWLSATSLDFPSPSNALLDPDGLLAIGGDLRPERLQRAYAQGIFPWYQDDQPILWWSPSVRMVLLPEELRISSSMRKQLRKKVFNITFDTAFASVIQHCAELRESWPGTWITSAMQSAYCQLHQMHVAHSVEVWDDKELVGGLYGISMGQMFFGESMFSLYDNASKTALIALTQQLEHWGYHLIDCQVPSQHLQSMGARQMPRGEFLQRLEQYGGLPGKIGKWTFELGSL